ncbi:uncharacterized protein LOC107615698 [Arachis ipaensis]|uniref:uncharacterized protein LOC107615698 n=1 Tax=Arachis ipaensis TaxID=130454 RepID=UPI0007AF55D1|nr:uncharacterized protein LOC107615698 [Arachis ipaensis]XP_025678679.1 uncharacterized protein LOC112778590 [Arachis hypogaea]
MELDAILAQNKAMSQQINTITQHLSGMQVLAVNTQDTSYDMSGGFPQGENYDYAQFPPEQRDQPQRQQNFNNSQGNFNQNNFNNRQFQLSQPQQKPSLPQNTSDLESIVAELSKSTHSFMQEIRASLRNLEIQVGQLSRKFIEIQIFVHQSGKVAGSEAKVSEEPVEKEAPEKDKNKVEHNPLRHPDNPFLVDLETRSALPKAPEYKRKMPYPQRLQKASKNKQFSRFLEIFRKLQINIPFVEALEEMPLYAKFMKELLSNKRN